MPPSHHGSPISPSPGAGLHHSLRALQPSPAPSPFPLAGLSSNAFLIPLWGYHGGLSEPVPKWEASWPLSSPPQPWRRRAGGRRGLDIVGGGSSHRSKKTCTQCVQQTRRTVLKTIDTGERADLNPTYNRNKWGVLASRQGAQLDGKLLRGTWLCIKGWGRAT